MIPYLGILLEARIRRLTERGCWLSRRCLEPHPTAKPCEQRWCVCPLCHMPGEDPPAEKEWWEL